MSVSFVAPIAVIPVTTQAVSAIGYENCQLNEFRSLLKLMAVKIVTIQFLPQAFENCQCFVGAQMALKIVTTQFLPQVFEN